MKNYLTMMLELAVLTLCVLSMFAGLLVASVWLGGAR